MQSLTLEELIDLTESIPEEDKPFCKEHIPYMTDTEFRSLKRALQKERRKLDELEEKFRAECAIAAQSYAKV